MGTSYLIFNIKIHVNNAPVFISLDQGVVLSSRCASPSSSLHFIVRRKFSHKTARFPIPVPLSTSLQDGRCYHVSLSIENGLNLWPSSFIRTLTCYPIMDYCVYISQAQLLDVIIVIYSDLGVSEPFTVWEFDCPGPMAGTVRRHILSVHVLTIEYKSQ